MLNQVSQFSSRWIKPLVVVIPLIYANTALADKPFTKIVSQFTSDTPTVDGNAKDSVWKSVKSITIHDRIANLDISVKSVYNNDSISFLVQFADDTQNQEHKTLYWDKNKSFYKTSTHREDTLIFKWAMQPTLTDISLLSDKPYRADIWYWKSVRTDHAGYADDKYQEYDFVNIPGSKLLISEKGEPFYLLRKGDAGKPAYNTLLHTKYSIDKIHKYRFTSPSGSRADVAAKGQWQNNIWTIEFKRKLFTGYHDDVQLNPNKKYYFGLSRYEIAGRFRDGSLQEPLFGSGDISELLQLNFSRKRR